MRKEKNVTCKICNSIFRAKRRNAMYCPNCKKQVINARARERLERERLWKAGKLRINPYFLTRGDPCKNLSSGISIIEGNA